MKRRSLPSPVCVAGAALCVLTLLASACSSNDAASSPSTTVVAPASASTVIPAAASTPTPAAASAIAPITAPPTTVPPKTVPPKTVPFATAAPVATSTPTTIGKPGSTPYGMPVAEPTKAGYAHEHHDYPATDIFVGCGAIIVSPVNGRVLESRRTDGWTKSVDNPATRGGKSVAILGDDGVRYYFAHFDSIDTGIEPGVHVSIGDHLGLMGRTGRAGACHLHFAISPPCPAKEWAVRRGVIWPWPYLDAWRTGKQLSPAAEIASWSPAHPTACADAMTDPNAAES